MVGVKVGTPQKKCMPFMDTPHFQQHMTNKAAAASLTNFSQKSKHALLLFLLRLFTEIVRDDHLQGFMKCSRPLLQQILCGSEDVFVIPDISAMW